MLIHRKEYKKQSAVSYLLNNICIKIIWGGSGWYLHSGDCVHIIPSRGEQGEIFLESEVSQPTVDNIQLRETCNQRRELEKWSKGSCGAHHFTLMHLQHHQSSRRTFTDTSENIIHKDTLLVNLNLTLSHINTFLKLLI